MNSYYGIFIGCLLLDQAWQPYGLMYAEPLVDITVQHVIYEAQEVLTTRTKP